MCHKTEIGLCEQIHFNKGKSKGKFPPRTGHEGPEWEHRYSSTLPLTLVLDGGGISRPRSGRFTPVKDSVPILRDAAWAPGSVWTEAKYFAPTGIRYPDRPSRSESLYGPS